MKILIVSYFYKPEATPRAYRASELVKELRRLGHSVEVLTCINEELSTTQEKNEYFVKPGFLLNRKKRFNPNRAGTKQARVGIFTVFARKLLKFYNRLFGGRTLEAAYYMYKWLKENKSESYDMCISIGLPFCSHLATALARRNGHLSTKTLVFDYGDPFYKNKHMGMFHSAFILESICLKQVDAITVPISEACLNFNEFNLTTSVTVVPQGFDFEMDLISDDVTLHSRDIPSVLFSGNFYSGIRNPIPFFELIAKQNLHKKIHLVFYADLTNYFNKKVFDALKVMEYSFEVHPFIPREQLLNVLSQSDILLNIGNSDRTASPSKLIDYAISGRPILTVSKDLQNAVKTLEKFLNKNYEGRTIVPIEKYHITNIARKFLELGE